MRCASCSHTMTTRRENAPYAALPSTVLVSVSVSRCANCGEREVEIPAPDLLNRALAGAVIRKRSRLTGGEVRFLRKCLGYSAADFARLIRSDPATVSRWEGDRQAIGHHTDLLLRAIVALGCKIECPIASFAGVHPKVVAGRRPRYAYMFARTWRPTELGA